MKKAEIQMELSELGTTYSQADLLPELREALKAARLHAGTAKPTPQKWGTEGMSAMSKAQLIQKAEGLGMSPGTHLTKDQLIVQIKKQILFEAPIKGTEIVNFGKLKGVSFHTVKHDHPSYAEWVVKENHEQGQNSHPEFARLARYCVRAVTPPPKHQSKSGPSQPPPGYETPKPKPTSNGIPKEYAASSRESESRIMEKLAEIDKIKEELEELRQQKPASSKRGTSSVTETMPVDQHQNVQGELLGLMKGIMQRLDNLEGDRSSDSSWAKPTQDEAEL